MADTKISALTDGGAVQATDQIPAVRAGANVRVQVSGGSASDFQPPIVTGNYYYSPAGAFSLQGLYGDLLMAFPIWFSSAETWTRIGLKLKYEETGKSIRLGIYRNGADNLPGALLADFGALSLSAPGDLEISISQALAANTVYWLAAVANTNAVTPDAYTIGYTTVVSNGITLSLLHSVLGSAEAIDPGTVAGMFGVSRTFSYAALPDPFGTPSLAADCPGIWLRKV